MTQLHKAVVLPEPDFELRWHGRDARYTVSKPNIGDTSCYTADTVRALLAAAQAPAADALDATRADARDTELLDFVEANTVTLEKEWEGPWQALVYGESESPSIIEDGKTAREALRAAIAAQAAAKEGAA